jgi:hypothetical protein
VSSNQIVHTAAAGLARPFPGLPGAAAPRVGAPAAPAAAARLRTVLLCAPLAAQLEGTGVGVAGTTASGPARVAAVQPATDTARQTWSGARVSTSTKHHKDPMGSPPRGTPV